MTYQPSFKTGPEYERELAAVTADLEFRRELGALQQQEYDKVTAERDALQKTTLRLMDEKIATEKERDASQQEARRLREALDKLHIACETSKPEIYDWYLTDSFASDARQIALEALCSTTAPVRSDAERLDWLIQQGLCWRNADLHIDGWRIGHETEWLYNVGEGARKTIDDAIDAELARKQP